MKGCSFFKRFLYRDDFHKKMDIVVLQYYLDPVYTNYLLSIIKKCPYQFLTELRRRLQVEVYIWCLENKTHRFRAWTPIVKAMG